MKSVRELALLANTLDCRQRNVMLQLPFWYFHFHCSFVFSRKEWRFTWPWQPGSLVLSLWLTTKETHKKSKKTKENKKSWSHKKFFYVYELSHLDLHGVASKLSCEESIMFASSLKIWNRSVTNLITVIHGKLQIQLWWHDPWSQTALALSWRMPRIIMMMIIILITSSNSKIHSKWSGRTKLKK